MNLGSFCKRQAQTKLAIGASDSTLSIISEECEISFYWFSGNRPNSLSVLPSLLQIHLKSFKTYFKPTFVNCLSVYTNKAKKRLILGLITSHLEG